MVVEDFKILLQDIPAQLYNELSNVHEVMGIYFCSPWLTELGIPGFVKLLQSKLQNKARFEILTRPPEDLGHIKMSQKLQRDCNAKIYVNKILHAKIYIVQAKEGSFAFFGSPNLTKAARSNLEIAIETYNNKFIDNLFNAFEIHFKPLCKYWGP